MVKEKTISTYQKIADTWDNKVWVRSAEFNAKIVEFADARGDEIALDVGIGTGALEEYLKLANVTGIDISKNMLDACLKKHPDMRLCLADAENLPFRDGSFDFVYCRNLLQNFNEPAKAFGEMYRVLKTNGKFMVIEGAVYENERMYVTACVRVVEQHHPPFPSHEQIRALFERFGFSGIEQKVEGVHKKWVSGFCKSKQASPEQRREIIDVCKNLPDWYKQKYRMQFFPSEEEIEQTLTFSFIKGIKRAA